jgi:hypothetical protein
MHNSSVEDVSNFAVFSVRSFKESKPHLSATLLVFFGIDSWTRQYYIITHWIIGKRLERLVFVVDGWDYV